MGCPAIAMRLLVIIAAARGAVFNESSRRHCTEAELEHLRTDKNAELHEVLSAVHGPRVLRQHVVAGPGDHQSVPVSYTHLTLPTILLV